MDNKYVDILLVISCIVGFVIGVIVGNYGNLIYNLIFFKHSNHSFKKKMSENLSKFGELSFHGVLSL